MFRGSTTTDTLKVAPVLNLGTIAEGFTPETIAAAVKELSDPEKLAVCRANCKTAATELTWENEEKVLEEVYATYQ